MKTWLFLVGLSIGTHVFAVTSISDFSSDLNTSFEMEAKSKFKESIQVLEKARSKDPNSYILNYRLGYLNSISGLSANAIEYFNKAIKIEPKSIEAHVGILNIQVAKGSWTDVKKVTQEILSIDEFNYIGGWNQIRAHIMLGKYDVGLKLVEKFLKVYPTDQTLLVQKAVCLGYAKKNSEAIVAYKDVQALYPADPTAKSALEVLK